MLERAFTMHLGLLLKLSKVNIMVNVYITYSYQNGTIDIMDDSGNCVCYGNSETIMYWLKIMDLSLYKIAQLYGVSNHEIISNRRSIARRHYH